MKLVLLAALALPAVAAIQEPVKVEGGLVSGTPGWAWNVREYRGIPFAAPPVGNLRWKPPQPNCRYLPCQVLVGSLSWNLIWRGT